MVASNAAQAQTFGVGVNSDPNLGVVASASSGDTTFTINAGTDQVSKSGNGARISSGSARGKVTVSCASGACTGKKVQVRVGVSGSPTGRARALTGFNVASGTLAVSSVSGTNPLTFVINSFPAGGGYFWLGATYPIAGDDSGKATGAAGSGFAISAVLSGKSFGAGTGSTADATVYRKLSIVNDTPLSFGRIVRPTSGSSTATFSATNPQRVITGSGVWLNTPSPTRAKYTITGEGGAAVSLSIPPSFTMTGPSTLTVTTDTTAQGAPVLSSITGNAGTYSFYVGGAMTLTSSTPSGAYSGSYVVTVSYN
ncbi:DUF4402 domain-containing protein [Phenylobacterium deserti]|nr:DUF4402 domain-containing protein [Phenylobacterium deserti]